ncbi:hypothetical protein XENOCAPTIV_003589 [Xenoophorus captivus]|uniref:Uncharacterized protein n=1 Tax=Xenoophorus captivus TaxID=1517983 RepID=A0ABV0Q7T8_9TELE
MLSDLTAQDLAAMLRCDRAFNSSGSKPVWKMFLSKASVITSASMILDSIRELRLDVAKTVIFNDPTFIQMWFGRRLRPFLPAVSQDFLSCLATKTLNCSTYQSM